MKIIAILSDIKTIQVSKFNNQSEKKILKKVLFLTTYCVFITIETGRKLNT